ncbi:MAG: hypothetical protein JWM21_1896 [Acidobacteria bacterium]|nr:hypothetical protein [Acidobacteriota bacterium]
MPYSASHLPMMYSNHSMKVRVIMRCLGGTAEIYHGSIVDATFSKRNLRRKHWRLKRNLFAAMSSP